ncbi:hypothetical protein DB346_17690 [Verrucomicrobia bacterium LW23]|nr:hypothetical protein DB346_17690 [Verrucomicrobia bacterium LW23]
MHHYFLAALLFVLCWTLPHGLAITASAQEVRKASPVDLSNVPQPDPGRKRLNDFSAPTRLDPRIKVSKVHMVNNDPNVRLGKSESMNFERQYWNFGAVTGEQQDQRNGNIFVFSWSNKGERADFTCRFEYRQVKSKAQVRTITIDQPDVQGTTRSIFAVVGATYRTYGPVTSYRLSIIRNGVVVGEQKSFVW